MKRSKNNPILTRRDIPESRPHLVDVSSVFNPGAVQFNGQTLLMLRVQNRGRETFLVMARSKDGERFAVDSGGIELAGLADCGERIFHVYDPRISQIGSIYYIMLALDTEFGTRLGLAETEDFSHFRFLGLVSEHESRNGVLFSEKIDGHYARLERPNRLELAGGVKTGSTIVLSKSVDLLNWEITAEVMHGRPHYWDEIIGSGPPPVKTRSGWLHIYHGVATHFASSNIYQVGVVLLDLQDPSQVLARSRYNILEPREPYELIGQVPNVVFPSGIIVEEHDADGFALDSSTVCIYYGAADTVVAIATTTVDQLISACYEGSNSDQ